MKHIVYFCLILSFMSSAMEEGDSESMVRVIRSLPLKVSEVDKPRKDFGLDKLLALKKFVDKFESLQIPALEDNVAKKISKALKK